MCGSHNFNRFDLVFSLSLCFLYARTKLKPGTGTMYGFRNEVEG